MLATRSGELPTDTVGFAIALKEVTPAQVDSYLRRGRQSWVRKVLNNSGLFNLRTLLLIDAFLNTLVVVKAA